MGIRTSPGRMGGIEYVLWTTLYVNGSFVGTLGNEKAFEEYATFVFPTERIGEETGQFTGEITFRTVKR